MILTLKDFLRIFKHVCSSESKMEQTFIKLKEKIKELNVNQVKCLIGFAETLEKARIIARMHGSLEAEIYCDNLQMRINDCDFRR